MPAIAPRDPRAVPESPGLYAVHAAPKTWVVLGLGDPPDGRPLYVGKAEDSLARRDIRTHFSNGKTGSSTLRRSLAALLHERLGLRACPRNPRKPGDFDRYGLEPAPDECLTHWMLDHLCLAVWSPDTPCVLPDVEAEVLRTLEPPLNLVKVKTAWTGEIKRLRAALAAEASAWSPER